MQRLRGFLGLLRLLFCLQQQQVGVPWTVPPLNEHHHTKHQAQNGSHRKRVFFKSLSQSRGNIYLLAGEAVKYRIVSRKSFTDRVWCVSVWNLVDWWRKVRGEQGTYWLCRLIAIVVDWPIVNSNLIQNLCLRTKKKTTITTSRWRNNKTFCVRADYWLIHLWAIKMLWK